jgi:predicted anti-sigma-YlaC factor YlaD
MKLDVRGFSIAVGTVVAAAFSICAFFVAVAPDATAAFFSYILQINLTGLVRAITWPSYFAGVVTVGVWTGLWAAVGAELYNLLISR